MLHSLFRNTQFRNSPFTRHDRVMDTILEQQIYGITASDVAEKVFKEIHRLEKLWNCFDPNSTVSHLNRMAGTKPVQLDPDTVSILKTSQKIAALTDNAFDITVLPLVQAWRRAEAEGKLPESKTLDSLISITGSSNIQILSDDEAFLPQEGQAVDLGGIAKGYAVDRAREIYLYSGIKNAIINFGGNVLALGKKADDSLWKIGIQKPNRPRGNCFGFVEASDCSVVTSGNYERYYKIAGKSYNHIIDPKTGWPISGDIVSATVITRLSVEADTLATAAVVLGQYKAQALFNNMRDHQIITVNIHDKVDVAGESITKFTLI